MAVRCRRRRRRVCVVVSGVQSRLYHTHSLHSVTVCDIATMCPPESLGNGLIVVLLIIFGISKRDVLGCVSWGQLCAWSLTLLTCLPEKVNNTLWRVFQGQLCVSVGLNFGSSSCSRKLAQRPASSHNAYWRAPSCVPVARACSGHLAEE